MAQIFWFVIVMACLVIYLLSLNKPDKKTIIELEEERLDWSLKTFREATVQSSLDKLRDEITEVEQELNNKVNPSSQRLAEEYVDCLMCLFDSAGRAGLTPGTLFEVFEKKLEINKARTWVKNENNTYSHVK